MKFKHSIHSKCQLATIVLIMLTYSWPATAQTGLSLRGLASFDVAPINTLTLEISVRNHSFVVLPPPLGFIRPITSSVMTVVSVPSGSQSISYLIEDIEPDPVDYTIQMKCLGCSDIVPTQYYTMNGNATGLVNSAFIDPLDFPSELNLNLITRGMISGEIELLNESSQDLEFIVEAFDSNVPEFAIEQSPPIILPAGELIVDYQIRGIRRNNVQLRLAAKCENCFGRARKPETFERLLSSQEDHNGINFYFEGRGTPVLDPILLPLLEEEISPINP